MKKNQPESLLSRREAASRMLVLLGGVVAYGCGGGNDPTGAGGSFGGSGGSGAGAGGGGFGGSSGAAGSTGGGAGIGGMAGRAGSGGGSGSGGNGGTAGSGGNAGGGAGTGGKGGTAGAGGGAGGSGGAGTGGSAGSGGAAGSGGSTGGGAGTGGTSADAGMDANGGAGGTGGVDAGRGGAAGSGGAIDAGGDACSTAWATGGTKAMTGNYPDPFVNPPTACTLITAVTEGPCTEAADQVRKDVSEGYVGLPVRLALRVVNSSCQPIAGAKIKIWHTNSLGSYSGNTPNNGMCLKNQSDSSKHYFRGVQTTDDNGRVDFDTCFPGWYMGRCIHIHFTVSLNGKSYTSQLIFDQTLVDDICKNHVDYKANGMPDTTNASDSICGSNVPMFTVKVERMCDGAMLASKVLVVNV